MRRILAVARVELALLLRSRTTFTLLILVPAIQVLLFGYAIRPGGMPISVVVAAPVSNSIQTLNRQLAFEPGIHVIPNRLGPGSAAAAVREGRALIGIEVPSLRSLANPFQAQQPIRIVVDGTNASLAAPAVARIRAAYWREIAERADAASAAPALQIERLYNPDERADWTFVPSLIGVTVMISMVMLGSLSIARERETGSWEGLIALPIQPGEMLAGKALPHVAIGTLQGALVMAAGIMLFDLPTSGSVAALIALLPLFAAAHFVLGYVLSTRSATQMAALQGAVAFYLPAMLLSGFLYPFDTLPRWARMIGNVFPLAHFIRAAQAAFLQARDAQAILAHGLPMLAFLGVGIGAALLASGARRA